MAHKYPWMNGKDAFLGTSKNHLPKALRRVQAKHKRNLPAYQAAQAKKAKAQPSASQESEG